MKKEILLALSLFVAAPAAAPLIAPNHAAAASSYETQVKWGVNFRSDPSSSAYIFRKIPKGEKIHVIGKVNSYWYKIKVQDGTIGYISTDPKYTNYNSSPSRSTSNTGSVSSGAVSGKADRVIADARALIGRVDYQFGVRNPARLIFDCSSFTEYVFEKNGVDMKWGTKQQQYQGSAVSKSNLKKGDLIFFWTSKKNIVNHVGIYIGNGQFIHNSPSNNVAINSLNTGYWKDKYIKARRVL
ncbi:C40 family peptidase [Paenibacillus abyssi]|uniref:Hydrolase Nlp/P60 n=1 Tax=Paenibacillus abyssi TaxID=1340531 RepID=A0A917CW44_9BACL|nr:SH3 domain-containing C40 family peptidase [Paenibacillus abyssi]GGF99662.1 hypothetical protein GCM10010916_16140 [Paenibacillus abyssi]